MQSRITNSVPFVFNDIIVSLLSRLLLVLGAHHASHAYHCTIYWFLRLVGHRWKRPPNWALTYINRQMVVLLAFPFYASSLMHNYYYILVLPILLTLYISRGSLEYLSLYSFLYLIAYLPLVSKSIKCIALYWQKLI